MGRFYNLIQGGVCASSGDGANNSKVSGSQAEDRVIIKNLWRGRCSSLIM